MNYSFTINVDRLELTYMTNEPLQTMLSDTTKNEFEFDSLRLIREQCKYYSNEFSIWGSDYDEQLGIVERKIGKLHFGSPNPNRPYIYLVYDNAALYSDYLLASRFYVQDVLGLDFLRVSKIDVAVDFNFNVVSRFYRLFKNPDYDLIVNGEKVKGMKCTVRDVLHIAGNTSRQRPFAHHAPVIKNADGSLLMRAYNKGKEIDEESRKEYIREKAGFKKLYRMEVSLSCHRVIKKVLERLNLTDENFYTLLQDEKSLIAIFRVSLNCFASVSRKRKSMSVLEPMFFDA